MNYRSIYHDDKQELVNLFVGKSVTKVDEDKLVLSDGTSLEIVPNQGACSCGAGDYYLEELNECENIITNVEVESVDTTDTGPNDYYNTDTTYHLFVYAENRKINLLTVQGSDGNGWYGSGFWIKVSKGEDS